MFCSKRNDMYRSSQDLDHISIQGSNYLSHLRSDENLEVNIQNIIQGSFEAGNKLSNDDIEDLTKKIINNISQATTVYLIKLFIQKDLYTNKVFSVDSLFEKEEREKEEKSEVCVVEGKNPCCNSFYDSSIVEFQYTNKNLGLIAVKKGTCFRCSAYKSILYSNVNNNSSQMCERCINEMFEDSKKIIL